ncbi:Mur ligase family protein [Pseudobdellovibrio exovorus]|uniref:Mur ligase central domain-containing protein n=1 Tax=Pseudobdellovibrio exovorus JSS TaxID=1184267 RepID=M4VE91_9BACT|nr:Mur ligase family protein [Pseudobdellovibrio exovorus]AGH96810.1 hypothetical protein A11Q_2594 [Pseudobdellovibrio exovorus JSS]
MNPTYILDFKSAVLKLAQIKIRSQRPRYERVAFFPRHEMRGSLFVAITHYDWSGYDYLKTALEAGVAGVVLETSHEHLAALIPNNVDVYLVESHRAFLASMAHESRQEFDGDVIAITGSTGKSQLGTWLQYALDFHFKTQFNDGNRNSFFGLCELLLHIRRSTQKLVVELGARQLGELSALGEILQPQNVVLTNIQHSHLKYLKNLQNVFALKTELLQVSSVETVFLNALDPLQSPLPDQFPDKTFIFYHPEKVSSELGLSGPHEAQAYAAVDAITDFLGATPMPEFSFWPKLPFSLSQMHTRNGQLALLDGRVTTPESLENFRKIFSTLLAQQKPPTSFALISGFVDFDPVHELAFIKTAAQRWAELPLKKIYYVGPHGESLKKLYLENGGHAEVTLGKKEDVQKILEEIQSLSPEALLAIQGHQEEWFFKLMTELTKS